MAAVYTVGKLSALTSAEAGGQHFADKAALLAALGELLLQHPAITLLAKGARSRGARIVEQVKVTRVTQANGRVTGVDWMSGAEQGHIAADLVVNCGGMWGRDLAAANGVTLPLHACEHFYIVTEPIPNLQRLPVLRVPDECTYYKEDAGKMLIGAEIVDAGTGEAMSLGRSFAEAFGKVLRSLEGMSIVSLDFGRVAIVDDEALNAYLAATAAH